MGKQTGFMEYARATNPWIDPLERIQNFNEFKVPLSDAERTCQAARCMDCGVPFCQSGMSFPSGATGCPLNSLIPEWNDMLYHGNYRHALARLLKRNNFPEFTGRVCPALCEAACTCGLNGQPVSCHDNELAIIETAFKNGWMQPNPPAVRSGKRVAVVGSGPSGLAAADRLNHRGHTVDVYERSDRPGGLLMYGIPNMKLDKSVVRRRLDLMEAEGVTFHTGVEVGKNLSAESLLRDYDAVVICCGASKPRDLNVENRDADGVYFAVQFLKATTESLLDSNFEDQKFIPAKGKNVVVVGGGDTGNDCVGTSIRLGCKSITQIEMMPCPPTERQPNNPWPYWPRVLKTDYGQQEAIAVFGHDPRIYETTVKALKKDADGKLCGATLVKLQRDPATGRMVEISGSEYDIECELLLIAAGFLGCEDSIASAFGVEKTPRGGVVTVSGTHGTAVPGLFTAGDMRRGQSLVVHAINEGRHAAKEVDDYLMGYTGLSN